MKKEYAFSWGHCEPTDPCFLKLPEQFWTLTWKKGSFCVEHMIVVMDITYQESDPPSRRRIIYPDVKRRSQKKCHSSSKIHRILPDLAGISDTRRTSVYNRRERRSHFGWSWRKLELPRISMSSNVCWICLDEGGELISQCSCRGTSGYVHEECLLDWFRTRGNWSDLSCPQCKPMFFLSPS